MNNLITIIYLGHACFKIIKNEYSIIIDPYAKGSIPGLSDLNESANKVLKTHDHYDHSAVDEINLINNDSNSFEIESYETFHDDQNGKLRGTNNVIIIKSENVKIVHMGDIGCDLSLELLDKIKEADALLIPVGGVYTIDYIKAKEFYDKIKPKLIIPMHYRGDGYGLENLDTVHKFSDLFDKVKFKDCSVVEVGENSGVVVLEPKNKI